MPPQGVDMNLIREALMRRMGGGGGAPVPPAIQQVAQPGAALPTGGPNVPSPQPAPMPSPNLGQSPVQTSPSPAGQASPTQVAAKAAGQAQGFPDPETRDMAKALLGKLVQFL